MMGKGKISVIVGLPGVGKSSVIDYAVKKLGEEGVSVKVVNYGTVMLEEALSRGLVSNRDEIRRLPVSKQMELQRIAAEVINNYTEEYTLVVLDTHLFIKTGRGKWPGLNQNNLPYLNNIRQIVLVEAKPEEIYKRRNKDETRFRADYGGLKEISTDLEYNRILAAVISIFQSCPVYIVHNPEGELEAAGEELYNLLKEVAKEE
jgi:adenylate kinase